MGWEVQRVSGTLVKYHFEYTVPSDYRQEPNEQEIKYKFVTELTQKLLEDGRIVVHKVKEPYNYNITYSTNCYIGNGDDTRYIRQEQTFKVNDISFDESQIQNALQYTYPEKFL